MPQITNLRLLFNSANHHTTTLFLKPKLYLSSSSFSPSLSPFFRPPKFPFLFASLSSYSKKPKNNNNYNYFKRNKSSGTEKGGLAMEEPDANVELVNESTGFNKKRALGRDNSDKPKKTLHLKVRKLNPANTISYVQILGTGMDTQDTSPSVLLFFDKQRFIFNAGEGLQRFCTEHKIKLSKIDHIFLSRVCSETTGGLPGLLLTLAAMGDEGMSVNVWGPSDLKYLVEAMKSFIPNAAMVHTRSFGPSLKPNGPSHEIFNDPFVLIDDEVIKLSAILLQPSFKESSASKSSDFAVTYICELPEIKGKFDPKKAVKLGLRPGPKYRELQLGNSVKSDRQDLKVHPSDVLGPSVPGPIVLLVDCPTLSHLQDLSSKEYLTNYYDKTIKNVNCIIHLSPASVTNTSEYRNWMSKFGGTTQHIMAGHEMRNIEIPILKSSARISARLNYLCPKFFPAPGFWSLEQQNNVHSSLSTLNVDSYESISAENLLKFILRPYANLGLEKSLVPIKTSSSEIIQDLLLEIPEIINASEQVSKLCDEKNGLIEEPWLNETSLPSCLENVTREDLEIVLLGTGSSQPSKYRNVTSIFINLFSKGSILFDCGEGTLGQLKRRFGIFKADEAVKTLKCIWISHIHADHHSGLARILTLRRDLLNEVPHEPLIVVGPRQLKRFLDAYQRLEDLNIQFLDCRHTTEASFKDFETNKSLFAKGNKMEKVNSPIDYSIVKNLKRVLSEAGIDELISFPVIHCPQAFGVVLKASERVNIAGKKIPGWKIVYSGDTRPCPELIKASCGATVLIHEATFEDGLVDEAIARNHSTTKEAIEVGDTAGVYRIILTHFSQRYPKIPVFDETHMHKTSIAFDLMSVNLADLHVLPRVLPYLKVLFKDEMIVDEFEELDDVDDDVDVIAA